MMYRVWRRRDYRLMLWSNLKRLNGLQRRLKAAFSLQG